MGIHKRGKIWYSQFQIKGKTYIQSARTTNKTLAKEYDRKFKNDVYSREYLGEREAITLSEALDQYLKTKKDTKNYRGVAYNVRTVKKYFDETLQLHDLTTALVERFVHSRYGWYHINKLSISTLTISRVTRVIFGTISSKECTKLIFPISY